MNLIIYNGHRVRNTIHFHLLPLFHSRLHFSHLTTHQDPGNLALQSNRVKQRIQFQVCHPTSIDATLMLRLLIQLKNGLFEASWDLTCGVILTQNHIAKDSVAESPTLGSCH